MRRGRWVAYCIAFFLVTSHYTLVTPSCYAASLAMTATVPVSPLWKESLQLNSKAKIDTSHAHILLVSQESLGIENIPVERQKIQLLILKDNILINEQEKSTNKKGVVDFVFISEKPGYYTIILVNKTDTAPFVVKNTNISL
ncbi:MAG: hypothetical protein NTZ55_01510 [Candidatus Roizmanbacteria bacterium]|nr:hypothetical protein [Candidatus Roizmanbacteria bacterium]